MRTAAGVLDSYYLGEALKGSARKLGERRGAAAVVMLANRLVEYIGSVDDDEYSYIWRSAIEEHEQDAHKQDTPSVLVDAVRDAALGATSTSSAEALATVRALLKSPYPTLTRIGIYVCGENYANVGEVFWECVKETWFTDVLYWHELYWLIRKGFPRFSSGQRARFFRVVEQLKGDWQDKSRQEEWDERQKRDLLHPAFGLGDAELDEKYKALVHRWGPVRDHPDFHAYTKTGWAGDSSPVGSDALLSMSDEALVAFLDSFVPDRKSWDGTSYRGVASSITAAVRASEDGFARRIALFADMARPYQHGLLRGLKERWSDDKRDIDWPATLALVQAVVSSPKFKRELADDDAGAWEPSIRWVVTDIADLIKSAVEADRHLPQNLYSSCLRVLIVVLNAVAPTKAGQPSDAVSHAMNSPRGRALETFIRLALAMRREELKANRSSDTWPAVGPVFEEELVASEAGMNADFAALAGMYCANLYYLNQEWTERNFDRLFPFDNEPAWRCAAQGFAYQQYLYDWLFKCLVRGGHLRRMVYEEGLPDQVMQKALQFLGLAYLEGMEALSEGTLMGELIAGLKVKQLSHLCWFFWTLRGRPDRSARSTKILGFWLKVTEQIQRQGAEVPELRSALIHLAVFVDELTPAITEALRAAAPYAQVRHHGYMLMETLARLARKYPKDVAAILQAALSGFMPDYRKEDVIACVNGLADAGAIEEAERICNDYAERGSALLKETYDGLRERQRGRTSAADEVP